MIRFLLWWLLMAACLIAAGVLVPLFTALAGATNLVFHLLDLANEKRLGMRLQRGWRLW